MVKLRKWMLAVLAFFISIGLWWNLSAEDVALSWTTPTTFTDGTPIPSGDLASARVYRRVNTGAYSLYQTVPIATAFVDVDQRTGTYCYQVTVVRANGVASPLSNEVCKTIDSRIPSAVTLTIQ